MPPEYAEDTSTDLHMERLDTVIEHLLATDARTVVDLGCGPGHLLKRLASMPRFQKIVGFDVSVSALAVAARELDLQNKGNWDSGRLTLLNASFAEPHSCIEGFDAALLVETIEHVPPNRLSSVEHSVFACCRPQTVIVTTPNQEYNTLYNIPSGRFRHPEHHFEWSRAKFESWALGVATRNKYSVLFVDIGPYDPVLGSPTQMANFTRQKCE